MTLQFRLKGFPNTKDIHIEHVLLKMNLGKLEFIVEERSHYRYVSFHSCTPAGNKLAMEIRHSPKKLIYGKWPNGDPKFWWIYYTKRQRLGDDMISVQLEILEFLRRDASEYPEPTLVGEEEDYTDENGQELRRQKLSNGAYLLTPK